MKIVRPYPVEIEWVDSAHTPGWGRPDEIARAASTTHCLSAGYLIFRSKTVVKIATNRHNLKKMPDVADYWGEVMSIPAMNVRKMRRLR